MPTASGCHQYGIFLMNGYQKSQSHMEKNSRVKSMDMYVDDKLFRRLEIQDRLGFQEFSSDGLKDGQNVKLVITGVYKGTKWKDTCISELATTCLSEIEAMGDPEEGECDAPTVTDEF